MMTTKKFRIKKITAILATLAILMTFVSVVPVTVNASENPSDGYAFGKTESNSFDEGGGERYYKFSLETSGEINFVLNAEIYYSTYQIYYGNIIKKEYLLWENSGYAKLSDGIRRLNETIDLTSGNYILRVSSNYKGKYSFSMNFTSAQESFKETESGSNNSFDTANTINLNTDYKAQIAINDTVDYYKFVLDKSGRINFKLNSKFYYSSYEICDGDFNVIWKKSYYASVTTGILNIDENIDLVAGTYYLVLKGNYYDYDMDYVSKSYESSNTGALDFSVAYQKSNETFSETQKSKNNSFDTANTINLNTDYKAQIAINDTVDYYKFVLDKSGRINFKLNSKFYYSSYEICDGDFNVIWKKSYYASVTTGILNIDENIDLVAGTYYLVLKGNYYDYDMDYVSKSYESSNTGALDFSVAYQKSNETFSETQKSKNNSFETAAVIDVNKDYTAQVALNDEIDYYKFTVQKGNSVNLIVNTGLYHSSYAIYDENKNEIWQTSRYRGLETEILELDEIIELTSGSYYFAIISDYNGYDSDYIASSYEYINTGDVKFRINAEVPIQVGDVNRDGSINIVDATLVQKYIVGLTYFNSDDIIIADVTYDGYITVRDATTVQKMAIGIL